MAIHQDCISYKVKKIVQKLISCIRKKIYILEIIFLKFNLIKKKLAIFLLINFFGFIINRPHAGRTVMQKLVNLINSQIRTTYLSHKVAAIRKNKYCDSNCFSYIPRMESEKGLVRRSKKKYKFY